MLIRISKYYLRFAILALLTDFSVFANALGWQVESQFLPTPAGSCYSSVSEACSATVPTGGTAYHATGAVEYGQWCVITNGTQNSSIQATNCVDSCPSGLTRVNGICECPPGQSLTKGDMFTRLNGGGTEACRTPAEECASRAGQSRANTWPVSSIEGCVVMCAANTGTNKATYPYLCTYTGQTMGSPPPSDLSSGTAKPIGTDPIAPEIPENCLNAATGPCPSGSSYGFVNGVAKCASTSSSCAPGGSGGPTASGVPIVNGAPEGTSVDTETKSTQTNSDGSTTTTIISSHIGGSSSGSSSGTGSGTGSGAGDNGTGSGGSCDPAVSTCSSGPTYGNADYSGWFDTAAVDQEITDKKSEFSEAFNTAKGQLSASLGISDGGGSMADFGSVEVLATSVGFDLSKYSDQLGVMRAAIILCSLVASAFIILAR